MKTLIKLFVLSLSLSMNALVSVEVQSPIVPLPQPVAENNSPEEVAFNDRRNDQTLFDKTQYRRDWDYRTAWRNDSDAYFQGNTRPDPAYYYNTQTPSNQYQPVYYQRYHNHHGHYYNSPNTPYYNNSNQYSYPSKNFQVIRGDRDHMIPPWDNQTYWRYNRDAFLSGNNRPYHYPDVREYYQENY